MSGLAPCAALDASRVSYLRLVEEEDAAYILKLRQDETLGKYLSASVPDVASQKEWIRRYKEREARAEEYYFIIMHESRNAGTLRIYDYRYANDGSRDSFCWGSWIVEPPRPKGLVTYSILMAYEIGFEVLGFRRAHIDVRLGNDRSNAFQLRHGAIRTGEDELNYYYEFPRHAYEPLRERSKEQIAAHGARRMAA